MAEAIVSVVMEQLVSIIRLEQEVRQVVSVRKEVTKLINTLELIRAVLADAEKKQFHENAVKVWIGALKDIMYDADDVLDEWYTAISISQSQREGAASGSRTTNKVISFFSSPCSCFQPVVFHRDIALRIKEIRRRLDDVARVKEQLNLIQLQSREDNRPQQFTSSIVDESEIHGRDRDKVSILSKVLPENSDQGIQAPVPVICIVGMGGLGKTTLAQLVFNDEQVTETFKHKIWVCVSEPFDRERVAKEIIVQASKENVQDAVGWEVLHQRLCSSVKGKRFLLVLDDVWTQNPMDWTQLKLSLVGGAVGSRIIITTRNDGVTKIVEACYTHPLKELSEDHCSSLFRHIAFQGRSQQERDKLEETGREIASKCKGIPLATKTIGSLMRFKQTKQEWRSVLQSDIWVLGKDFFPALQLSYHSLPVHLKQCFMYTAIFPKDTRLEKDRLVKLWMAQGFIRSHKGIQPEIVAGEYFDDLAMRSFFQDFKRDNEGKVIYCKMHDFLHDVAQSLTEDECHIMETNDSGLTNCNKVRHVNAWNTKISSPFTAKNLRTLILKPSTPTQVLKQLFLQYTCLRALELHGYGLIELPDEVQCLLHLRYLDLSDTKLSRLPETLCNLYNLQTLKLNTCRQLGRLPKGIGRLSNLRHLEVECTNKLEYIPQSIGKLSQLRTLHKFVVSGASRGCKVGELRQLNSLSGGLQIHKLKQVENVDESKGAQMLKKKDIAYLWLGFDYSWEEQAAIEIEEVKRMEGVLEGLQPNANLEYLEIDNYPGLTFPFWMSSTLLLCNVTTMKLTGCRNCNQLPALGNLESLESLVIYEMKSMKHIGADFYGVGGDTCFPKLQTLELEAMPEWENWEIPFSKFKKVMPRLRDLKLKWCGKLMGLPALGRLEYLESLVFLGMKSLKHIGAEFYGVRGDTCFPKLQSLELDLMREWEDWEIPFSKMKKVMPRLRDLKLKRCGKLMGLPALGRLESLESLLLHEMESLKHIGADFYGVGGDTCFPKLQSLKLMEMQEWEDWEIPFSKFKKVMPHLSILRIEACRKLKALPGGLGQLPSLEDLYLVYLDAVKHVGADLVQILDGSAAAGYEEASTSASLSSNVVLFPKLTTLKLRKLLEWTKEGECEKIQEITKTASIMPNMQYLRIHDCTKLKVLPLYMFPHSLRILELFGCPRLEVIPCLPLLLEEILLYGDLGVVSTSLMSSSCDHNYPNLKTVRIFYSPHSLLPQGLSKFTSLQQLEIYLCRFLDLKPEEELRGFPMLQQLLIKDCVFIRERCEREDWVNTLSSHIAYNIQINGLEIHFTKRR